MADVDDFVQCPPNSTGQKTDCSSLLVNGQTVLRPRMVLSDPSDPLAKAAVVNGAPANNAYGSVVRPRVEDGADVALGAIADAAVTGDSAGTLSAKLRGLIKMLGDVWDGATHSLQMKIIAALPAGANIIGKVGIDPAANTVALGAGAAVIGHVIMDAGSTTAVTGNVAVTNANLDVAISTRLKPADTLAGVTAVGSITNALPAGANVIGGVTVANLDVALSTRLKPADPHSGVTSVGSITNALPAGANVIGHVIMDAGSTTAVSGTVVITSTQLPAALGSALSAASLSVVLASDATLQTVDDGALILTRLDWLGSTLSTATDNSGRLRVFIDPLGGAQTLGTVSTVTTVTTVSTVTAVTAVNTVVAFGPSGAGVDAVQTFIHQLWQESWAASVGSRMT